MNARLAMDSASISKAIREKKKKMMTSEPEMIGTDPTPDMNAQDIYDTEQRARVESTLMSPKKINADLTNMDQSYDGVGVSSEEKTRMGRLSSYFDKLSMW